MIAFAQNMLDAEAAEKKHARGLCVIRFCRKHPIDGRRVCQMHRMRDWRAKNPERDAFINLRHSAKRRGHDFDLTHEQFHQFCVRFPYLEQRGVKKDSLHIDRINPALGYTFSNIRPLTCSENVRRENYRRGGVWGRN